MTHRVRYKLSLSVFLVLREGDTVLLIKRGTTGWMDGYYSLPAGAIDGGETLDQAVTREAKEELGIEVKARNVTLLHIMHCLTNGEEWLGAFFLATKWKGTPKVNEPRKHTEVQWASLDQLPAFTIPYVKQALVAISNHEPYSAYG